jgi:DNA-binding transcriptional LysR family regulator
MDIKQLRFLMALAREQHFGRAADACFVSQPTLSARIRQLEQELGVMLVERAQHSYRGLTAEGERVLHWANRIVADCDAMKQDVSAMQHQLTGAMTLGVVPSALPFAPVLTEAFHHKHPEVTLRVLSRSSKEIQRGLDSFDLEVGITYVDNEPLQRVRILPLYPEHYVLVSSQASLRRLQTMTWAEAGQLPLCLLTPDMQYRRIVDGAFCTAAAKPAAQIETNSITNLYAQVLLGQMATVLPESFLDVIGLGDKASAVKLTEPEVCYTIGLVASDRDPPSPLAQAMFDIGETADLSIPRS